jgi:hypothetical protein
MTRLLELHAVVEAAPERVAALVLDVRPGGRSPLAVTGTVDEDDGDRLVVTQDGSRITMTVDRAAASVTLEGEWWYRGVTRVEPDPRGARLRHEVYNIASGNRWAVRLVSRGPLNAAPATFAGQVEQVGRALHVPAWVEDD